MMSVKYNQHIHTVNQHICKVKCTLTVPTAEAQREEHDGGGGGCKIWRNVRTLTSLDTRSGRLGMKLCRASYSLPQVELRVSTKARLLGTSANDLN